MTATATATKTRPNTYAGSCSNCHGHVAAQAGVLGAKVGGRWTVRHTNCGVAASQPSVRPTRYEHATPAAPSRGYYQPRRTKPRSCPTDGNCSSYSGRSCGADDCG